jgi:hypothetical protein
MSGKLTMAQHHQRHTVKSILILASTTSRDDKAQSKASGVQPFTRKTYRRATLKFRANALPHQTATSRYKSCLHRDSQPCAPFPSENDAAMQHDAR